MKLTNSNCLFCDLPLIRHDDTYQDIYHRCNCEICHSRFIINNKSNDINSIGFNSEYLDKKYFINYQFYLLINNQNDPISLLTINKYINKDTYKSIYNTQVFIDNNQLPLTPINIINKLPTYLNMM